MIQSEQINISALHRFSTPISTKNVFQRYNWIISLYIYEISEKLILSIDVKPKKCTCVWRLQLVLEKTSSEVLFSSQTPFKKLREIDFDRMKNDQKKQEVILKILKTIFVPANLPKPKNGWKIFFFEILFEKHFFSKKILR